MIYCFKKVLRAFKILALITFLLNGQSDFLFNNISVNDGLSESTVKVVYEDKDGFIYFGTENGLDLYNGYEFENFQMNSFDTTTIFGNKISTIYQSQKNKLWLGTELGITVFNLNDRSFSRPSELRSTESRDLANSDVIIEDDYDNIWLKIPTSGSIYRYNTNTNKTLCINCSSNSEMGTSKGTYLYSDKNRGVWVGSENGLFRYNSQKNEIVKFSFSDNINESKVNVIKEGEIDDLWIGTENGLVRIDLNTRKVINIYQTSEKQNWIVSNNIKDIDWNNAEKELWIATDRGLSRFVLENEQFFNIQTTPYADGIIENNISEILYAKKSKRLWFTTENYPGINCLSVVSNMFNGKNDTIFTHFEHDPIDSRSIADNKITDFIEDRAGNIWITTAQNGVSFNSHVNPKFINFKYDSENEWGLKSNKIYSIAVQDDGMLWVATGFGLELLSPDGIRDYEYDKSDLMVNYLIDIEVINAHILWAATDLGVLKINTMSDDVIRFTSSKGAHKEGRLANNLAHDISLIGDKVWVATESGLSIIDTLSNSVLNIDENLATRLIFKDNDGDIWLGSDSKGLHRIQSNLLNDFVKRKKINLDSYTFNPLDDGGISSSKITCIAQDSLGTIWIGTNGGLNRYSKKTKTFRHFFTSDGLPSNYITGIVVDRKNNLWVSSKRGISFFNQQNEVFKNYGLIDDIGNIDFHRNSFDVSNNLEIYFGGPHGITKIVPHNIRYNQYKPPCKITRIKKTYFDGAEEEFYSHMKQKNSSSMTEKITIDHKVKSFTIDFVSLNYHKSEKNKYRYKLIPFDRDWIESGGLRFASYNNLGRNTYKFVVQGSNDDGVWSDPENLAIKFIPHPMLSLAAISVYILLAAIMIFLYVRHRMIKQKSQLDEERRIRELEEARKFQMSLIPQNPPTHPDYDIAFHMKTSTEVGGDYYDFFPQEDGSMYVVCGDATGHGLNAGMMVSITKAGLYGSNFDAPDSTTTRLNRTIKAIDLGTTRMSLNMAKFHNGSFDFTSAGMPPAYLYKSRQNSVDEILVPGLPLGSMKKADFDLHSFKLESSDVLVLISDGLPECVNHDGKMLDYQAVKDCILKNGNKTAQDIVDSLINLGDNWMSGLMNDDDITLVVIKRN